ncbi:phenylpyruvate tautomerase PptA (4-oxalocrotonate tautomerase family) [Actinomadura pelletieri DSM 43383]|uniref:Phenylpyruvate tautomerase PptA (4-oxalocrotonate tautomerase family) n=1 Tax=Actinomadura pelletieri DSM 43383 TaxID=1120940 RepID=A0A495QZE9_9ACTN|nr:tautomerase family protein [Actinomadura pelletieri]RKS79512.1 phenylpyruvate tautomerase PptA (4-oxalocrotonate tautomerase family) [Actinomadura pelletieri DSM 43383]
MPFVELFVRKGSLDEDRRNEIGGRLVSEVMIAEGAPDNEAARSISWLVVNEVDAWFVGGQAVPPEEKPKYMVRVGVPAGSMNDDKRRDIVKRVTQVLADADTDPERFTGNTAAWVHINEVPEGNWGARGEIVRIEDIVALVTKG